jgi:hypothetical protein
MTTARVMTPRPKIYFAGSIRGGSADRNVYHELIAFLGSFGEVLTEHVGDGALSAAGEGERPDREIYLRDLAWMRKADVFIAEVTTPSLGVGYEIAKAEELGKPILCLYRTTPNARLSAMIAGSGIPVVKEYRDLEEAMSRVAAFLASLGMRSAPPPEQE